MSGRLDESWNNGCIDGLIDEWMDGEMDWIGGLVDREVDGWIDFHSDWWMDGYIKMYGLVDGWI